MIEQNNQKIIIIAGGVLFFIVILLIIFISIFSKKGTTIPGEPNSTNAPTPTTYKINPFTNKRGTPHPSGTVGSDEFPLKLNQEKDRAFLENLYRNIANDKRFKNKDFDLYYSEKYKKFVFIKKTADAEKRLAELLQNVGVDLNELIRTFASNPLSAAMIDLTNRQYSNNLSKTEMELLKEAYKNNPNLFKDAGINMTYDAESDTFFLEVNSQQEIDNFNNFASNSSYKNVLKDSDYIKLVNTPTINNQKTKEVTKDVIKLMFSNTNGRNTKPFNVLLNEQSKVMDVEGPDSSERDIEETTTGRILKSIFSFNIKVPKKEENTTEFNVITRVPPQSSSNNGDSDLPPIDTGGTDLSQLDYAAWGLPPPKAEDSGGARGYNRLLSQIRSGNGNWGALVLLEGERAAKKKGYNVVRYLNTAWIWFENGSASYPDPYQVNCNDDRPGFTSTSNSFCSSTNFQIAGYQAATRRKDYVSAFHKFYTDEQLLSVLQRVISNSSRASQSKWSYNGITLPSNITISNISPNADFFDPTIQKYTLILGKDPVIVAALNSYAVSSSDLIRVLKTQQCGYGYICATEKQILSNMAAALYILENGSLDAPGGSGNPGTGGGAASDNTQSVLAQAQRILPTLQRAVWNFYNKHTQTVSGNGYTTPYRAGLTAGSGSTTSQGIFWCTNLVISSYRLAGFPELKEGAMESVIAMRSWWQQQRPGYLYVNYQTSNKLQALRNVKPGCAFFFENNGQHTGLVKSVNLDGNGNGSMIIYESNSGRTESTFPVANGVVKNTYGMELVGFGCRK